MPLPLDRVAYAVATGAGAGFLPVAPGTFGAAEGVLLYLAAASLANALSIPQGGQLALMVVVSGVVLPIAVWSANRACRLLDLKDPGQIVIDEVIGQLIALIPLASGLSLTRILIGFLLFRLFDIFKPYPIRRLEQLPGGAGVVADDVLAGVYSALLLWAVVASGII